MVVDSDDMDNDDVCNALAVYIVPFDDRLGLIHFTSPGVSTMTVGHRLRSTPTNGHRFTALSLPWRSPILVLSGLDVTITSGTESTSNHRAWYDSDI